MNDPIDWRASRAKADAELYNQYGRPLEAAHRGEFVAISPDGRTILGSSDVEVLKQAVTAFGSGNFAFKRIGHRTLLQWLGLR